MSELPVSDKILKVCVGIVMVAQEIEKTVNLVMDAVAEQMGPFWTEPKSDKPQV